MGKTKLHITVEFDDIQGLNSALKKVSNFYVREEREQFLGIKSNYRLRINREIEDQSELIDCKFERVEIDGKEKVCMIIPSQLNKE